jgi:CO/xanthine dehydrogenase Mo-binding subunit
MSRLNGGEMSVAYGAVLRSSSAYARIRGIDAERARALPGVIAVLTGEDVLDLNPYYGHLVKDRPLIAIDRVRFAGEAVAAVAAETLEIAEQARDLIEVVYEELPHAVSLEEALAPGAPRLHVTELLKPGIFAASEDWKPQSGNICSVYRIEHGEIRSVEGEIVVEGEYRLTVDRPRREREAATAAWGGRELSLWSPCRAPDLVRTEISGLFQLPIDSVRVVPSEPATVPFLTLEPLAAALARKSRRPIQLSDLADVSHHHEIRLRMRTTATSDGHLRTREIEAWLAIGAYAGNAPRVIAVASDAALGAYRWEAVEVDARGIYTNSPPLEDFETIMLQTVGEEQIDELARRCNLDPDAIRAQNSRESGAAEPLDSMPV